MPRKGLLLFVAWCTAATGAAAQTLPDEPVTLGDGRLVVSGDVSASAGSSDEGFFNYSDYEHSTLRELRLSADVLVRATNRISFLGEIRSNNLDQPTPFAAYARIQPLPGRRLAIQIGRIPPTFGRFPRQAYGRDNPLIGYPLAYQYLVSLRPDAVPADASELLQMRGRGWLSSFSVGNPAAARGVPLVNAFAWDTGVQLTTGWRAITVTGAVTNGTVSNPRVSDNNGGKQIAARMTVSATPGLTIGSSFARGEFLGRGVVRALADGAGPLAGESFTQRAFGADVEYSRGHLLARAEGVLSEWRMPFRATGTVETLRALGVSVEGRYTFMPGAYAAVRADHLGFNRLAGPDGSLPWEAPVSRIEIGGGYYLQRNLLARMSVQVNDRDGGRIRQAALVSSQILFWF